MKPSTMAALCGVLLGGAVGMTAATAAPDFGQVRALIQTNLPGADAAALNQLALDGLLHGLRGKVTLLEAARPGETELEAGPLAASRTFDGSIAYLRVAQVMTGLAAEIKAQCEAWARTNQLKGLVLDLRFAQGDDYAAAAAVADLFVTDERALLDWGNGVVKSTAKPTALPWPVAVLVNNETTGAPEAVAALLRELRVGLLLGSTTRGAAMTAKEFPLTNGQRLRIATDLVKLGRGTPLSPDGVRPDIQVTVTTADESRYLADPFALISQAATNLTASATNKVVLRPRTNEADLVRARREGLNLQTELPHEAEAEPPVIRDPALGRAVDLLKGLAVVRRGQP